MLVKLLASSSRGNCCFVQCGETRFIIDMGISTKRLRDTLSTFDVLLKNIDFILITHSHIDHVYGLNVLNKNYDIPIYMTKECYSNIDNNIKVNIIEDTFKIGDITIEPVVLSHDVHTIGFIISYDNKSLVYVTDTGYINRKLFNKLHNKNIYVFESNYDIEMIQNSTRHPDNVRRVLSDKGHLSNEESSFILSNHLVGDDTKAIILAHLSLDHNTSTLAYNTLKNALVDLNKDSIDIYIGSEKEDISEVAL